MKMNKKFVTGMVLTVALAVTTIPAIAAPVTGGYVAPTQTAPYDAETAKQNYIAGEEARKTYLADIYSRGLITKEQYDLNIANIQANIDYVEENGLPDYGYGYGYGMGGYHHNGGTHHSGYGHY